MEENDDFEENTVKSMYIFEGKDYTEDRQAFKRIMNDRKTGQLKRLALKNLQQIDE